MNLISGKFFLSIVSGALGAIAGYMTVVYIGSLEITGITGRHPAILLLGLLVSVAVASVLYKLTLEFTKTAPARAARARRPSAVKKTVKRRARKR